MTDTSTPLLVLDLLGTFAFALNGALTALRYARLDVVGVVTLGTVTALGGGVIRDVLLGSTPPATFRDWRYFAVAGAGSLLAFGLSRQLDRRTRAITALDAMGLSLFAVAGASKALEHEVGAVPAVLLGAVTAVGGGTVRDVLLARVPTVLHSDLYALPALIGSALTVGAAAAGIGGVPTTLAAATAVFVVRMSAVRYGWHAPGAANAATSVEVARMVMKPRRGVRCWRPREAPTSPRTGAGAGASTGAARPVP